MLGKFVFRCQAIAEVRRGERRRSEPASDGRHVRDLGALSGVAKTYNFYGDRAGTGRCASSLHA
jgi:hypothetical protein